MCGMFMNCKSLESLNLGNFKTVNVRDMSQMFTYCGNLESLNVSSFDTSEVTDMHWMFFDCSNLTSLLVDNFDTQNVTSMAGMFGGCSKLTSLNISNFNTNNVTSFTRMFEKCSGLTTLDMSGFDVGNITEVSDMLFRCINLSTIYTPYNLNKVVTLPINSGDIWYCSDGSTVTELPLNLSYSITLGKNYIPEGKSIEENTFNFKYRSDINGNDATAKCYYKDEYFYAPSSGLSNFNQSLATMSLSFAMSAFASNDESEYKNKSANARELLEKIGCDPTSIETNDGYKTKPSKDSIGVIAGKKSITVEDDTYTLIAVAIRGAGYEQEWAGNFNVGVSGEHEGFNIAKNEVIYFLREYTENNNINGKVKIWITGYSRAAAVANLVGGALDKGLIINENMEYTLDDIYVYTFETPAGALISEAQKGDFNDPIYNNIFNIINANDPVPYVAPASMGFARYGIDMYLPSAEFSDHYSDEKRAMLNNWIIPSDYIVDDFQMKKLGVSFFNNDFVQDDTKNNFPQGVYLSNFVNYIGKDFLKNRQIYVLQYQNEIREVMSIMFGCNGNQADIMKDSLLKTVQNNWGDFVGTYIWNTVNPWGDGEEAYQIVSGWIKDAVDEAGITDYDEITLNNAGTYLSNLLLKIAEDHPNYAITLIMNMESIASAHYPELCYSWMVSMDPNYSSGADGSYYNYYNGKYREIRVNCDVDVYVYDKNDELVASIVDEIPSENSMLITGIDYDGQKIVILPASSDYRVEIQARNSTEVCYGINEYSALEGEYNRTVNYFNVNLLEGQTLSGDVPAYNEDDLSLEDVTIDGTEIEYTLIAPSGETITKDSDFSGDDATSAYFMVNITTKNEDSGIVLGAGMRQYGNFAAIEAVAMDGYAFEGWYVGDGLVSNDAEYRFLVTEDVDIVGVFKEAFSVKFDLMGHGTELEEYTHPKYRNLTSESIIEAPASPREEGYIFTGWYKEASCENKWDFAVDTVQGNVTLYAGWEDASNYRGVLPDDIPADGIIPDGIWSAGIIDTVYIGSNITQSFRIYDGNKRLQEKVDYTISYKNNKTSYTYTEEDYSAFESNLQNTGKSVKFGSFDPKKAPQVIIKMKGNYSGSRTIYFQIKPANITDAGFIANNLAVTYSGKKQTPAPTVTRNGKALKYNTDFYVQEYNNAKNDKTAFLESATYDLTIIGKSNFTGEIPIKLTISESKNQIIMNSVTIKGISNKAWTG